jgi:hypothetical protein
MKISILLIVLTVIFLTLSERTFSQIDDPFKIPEIRKVDRAEAEQFSQQYIRTMQWTGQGFQAAAPMDFIPAVELRARFQAVYGDPSRRLEDLILKPGFRLAEAIQYEYWFIVDEKIPIMVLDIDGPFATGLVYAGPIIYIDYFPEIKRTLSAELLKVNRLEEFTDMFYSPERNQWYEISYKNGEFKTEEINRPARYRGVNLNQ